MLVLGTLTDLTGSVWTAGNLHLFVVLVATAVASFLVLRWMGAKDLLSGAGALVFTFSPAVYNHVSYGHPFLVGLYPIPLAVYLALRWGRTEAHVDRDIRRWPRALGAYGPSVLSVTVIALSSTYYAAYAVMIIGLFGLLSGLRSRNWAPVLRCGVVVMGLLAVFGLSSAPDLLSSPEVAPLERKLSDVSRFALRPLEMLLPQEGHPIGLLGGWGAGSDVAVGLVAAVGLVLLGVHAVRTLGSERDALDHQLNRLAGIASLAIVIGVAGGLGWGVARLGVRELRVWSRISTFVAFCAVAAVVLLLGRFLGRRNDGVGGTGVPRGPAAMLRSHPVPVVAAVVLVALLDQRAPLPNRTAVQAAMSEDQEMVTRLASDFGDDASVLQWPSVAFPDDFSSERLLTPALLSDGLRFSAGAFRGGPGDWQHSWALQPIAVQVRAAAAAGFDALLVQVDHHLWDGSEATAEVIEMVGGPRGTSADGTWAWWDLRPLREDLVAELGPRAVERFSRSALRPLGMWVSGTEGFPSLSTERDAALGEHGAIQLRAYGEDTSAALVTFRVAAANGSRVTIRSGGHREVLTPGPSGADSAVTVHFVDDTAAVRVSVGGQPLRSEVGRVPVHAELHGIAVFDADLAESPVAAPVAFR